MTHFLHRRPVFCMDLFCTIFDIFRCKKRFPTVNISIFCRSFRTLSRICFFLSQKCQTNKISRVKITWFTKRSRSKTVGSSALSNSLACVLMVLWRVGRSYRYGLIACGLKSPTERNTRPNPRWAKIWLTAAQPIASALRVTARKLRKFSKLKN